MDQDVPVIRDTGYGIQIHHMNAYTFGWYYSFGPACVFRIRISYSVFRWFLGCWPSSVFCIRIPYSVLRLLACFCVPYFTSYSVFHSVLHIPYSVFRICIRKVLAFFSTRKGLAFFWIRKVLVFCHTNLPPANPITLCT